ncbi:hypothetical protein F5Y15DRAFT_399323 [Xylariaceae sp. FL0016]|nr:hypothetical protein F5Y15DRAFT_399323 [Xylariaceae sp. FL0016]
MAETAQVRPAFAKRHYIGVFREFLFLFFFSKSVLVFFLLLSHWGNGHVSGDGMSCPCVSKWMLGSNPGEDLQASGGVRS